MTLQPVTPDAKVPVMYVGVDPGLTGWIAALDVLGNAIALHPIPCRFDNKGRRLLDVKASAELFRDLLGQLQFPSLKLEFELPVVAVEEIAAGPSMSKHATASLAAGAATFVALAHALGASEVRQPRPQVWQLGLRTIGEASMPIKDLIADKARRAWPGHVATLKLKRNQGACDALLIADWARRTLLWQRGFKAAEPPGLR